MKLQSPRQSWSLAPPAFHSHREDRNAGPVRCPEKVGANEIIVLVVVYHLSAWLVGGRDSQWRVACSRVEDGLRKGGAHQGNASQRHSRGAAPDQAALQQYVHLSRRFERPSATCNNDEPLNPCAIGQLQRKPARGRTARTARNARNK